MKNILLLLFSTVLSLSLVEAALRIFDIDLVPNKNDPRDPDSEASLLTVAKYNNPLLLEKTLILDRPNIGFYGESLASEKISDTKRDHFEYFKAWNLDFFLEGICKNGSDIFHFDNIMQGKAFVYKYLDDRALHYPRYSFLPRKVTPFGLRTNEHGLAATQRRKSAEDSSKRLLKIAFVGASTTVSFHKAPYRYPDLVSHYLNQYLDSIDADIEIVALNFGREGVNSTDIAAIVEHEVSIFAPDLILYYEGSNQFNLYSSYAGIPLTVEVESDVVAEPIGKNLRELKVARLLPRVLSETAIIDVTRKINPSVNLSKVPDRRSDLPLNLNTILADLDAIKRSADRMGATFMLASFPWLSGNDVQLLSVRDSGIISYWPAFPVSMSDLKDLADFQNKVFARWADSTNTSFIDLASLMPADPMFFSDLIHQTVSGIHARSWIVAGEIGKAIDLHDLSAARSESTDPQGYDVDSCLSVALGRSVSTIKYSCEANTEQAKIVAETHCAN